MSFFAVPLPGRRPADSLLGTVWEARRWSWGLGRVPAVAA
jgi:hypothetical protein